MPTVSVLMSVYNEPLKWAKAAIDSIVNQTFTDFEFVIINDNPRRKDLDEFLALQAQIDSRIKIHTNPENIGLTKSLNVGLKLCSGKYIARMDADDISLPTRFTNQVSFMELNPDVIVCGTDVSLFGDTSFFLYTCLFEEDIDIRGQMLSNSGFAHSSVLIRRSVLTSNNIQYDESFQSAQDYRLWEQLCQFGKFHNIHIKLLKYRISSRQITRVKKNNQTHNRDIIKGHFSQLYKNDKLLTANTKITDFQQKILNSYFLRSTIYESFSLRLILKFILTNKTKCSIKEIVFLILYSIYIKIKPRKH